MKILLGDKMTFYAADDAGASDDDDDLLISDDTHVDPDAEVDPDLIEADEFGEPAEEDGDEPVDLDDDLDGFHVVEEDQF